MKRVDLGVNQIGIEGIKFLCEGLTKNKSITILDLFDTGISNEGMKYVSELLKKNDTLKEIILDCNFDFFYSR